MRRIELIVIALISLGIGVSVFRVLSEPVSLEAQAGASCTQLSNGNVMVAPMQRFLLGPNEPSGDPVAATVPQKITLTEDLSSTVRICREHASGTTCKTVGEIFGQ